MKKYFLMGLIVAITPSICFGASARYTQLVREKQRKMAELEKCMGATNGLKIAGLSTLGLTAVGVAGNIAEAKKIQDNESYIKSADKKLETLDEKIKAKTDELNKIKKEKEDSTQANNTQSGDTPETPTTPTLSPYIAAPVEVTPDQKKQNCINSGGTPTEWGTCQCKYGYVDDYTGTCYKKTNSDKSTTISQQPTGTNGQELTGVAANNNFVWNPVEISDNDQTPRNQTKSNPQPVNNSNPPTGKSGTAPVNNGAISTTTSKVADKIQKSDIQQTKQEQPLKSENSQGSHAVNTSKQSTNTGAISTTTKTDDPKQAKQEQQTITNKDNQGSSTTQVPVKNEPIFVQKDPVTPVDNTYVAPKTAQVTTQKPIKLKPDNKNDVTIPTKTTQNERPEFKPSNKGTPSGTRNSDNRANPCSCASVDQSNAQRCTEMFDGKCELVCRYGYIFNSSSQKCVSGTMGPTTGYIK